MFAEPQPDKDEKNEKENVEDEPNLFESGTGLPTQMESPRK